MTKNEFKKRWESDDKGGGITFDDIAECAKKWGITHTPRPKSRMDILYKVLKAADVEGVEAYKSEE